MLSIVIPARQEERAIGATVSRLDALDLPHEIIVADDASEDRTAEVARAVGARVVTLPSGHRTPGRSRNAGAKLAQGDYLVFVDADVTIPDQNAFFRHALAHFEADARLVGLCGPQRARPEVETWADRLSFGALNASLHLLNNVVGRGEASGKYMLVRRTAFEQVRGFREDLATREDGDLFYRLSRIGTTRFDPSLLIYHGARRAHAVGWAKLWYTWLANTFSVALFDHAIADEWKPVR